MQASTQPIASNISCDIMPVLRRNDKQNSPNEQVKYLQQLLNNYGFRITADGFFGAKTEVAVKEFQGRSHEEIGRNTLTVDGIVGPQTWQALGACYYGC